MSNSSTPFSSKGTRVFHGMANGTIAVCRLVARDSSGFIVACPSGTRPIGVSPANFVVKDDMDYHRMGIASVETDGSAVIGQVVKADAGGLGKAILDSAPGFASAGVLVTLDPTTNIGNVELFV